LSFKSIFFGGENIKLDLGQRLTFRCFVLDRDSELGWLSGLGWQVLCYSLPSKEEEKGLVCDWDLRPGISKEGIGVVGFDWVEL
jgi:hypothetical protein